MVDQEVETILREIRERIVSRPPAKRARVEATPVLGNGDGNPPDAEIDEPASVTAEVLDRLDGYLYTTARSWDRLPPVVSNRNGVMARLEIWFKAKAKLLARWFTWEQINFNAAVHHALLDTQKALRDQDNTIQELENKIRELQANLRESHARLQQANTKLRQEQAAALQTYAEAQQIEMEQQQAHAEFLREAIEAQRTQSSYQRGEVNILRAEIRGEAEARRIHLEDLQRQLEDIAEKSDPK